jgi:MOSC domain-containing protein YiiM
MHGVIERLSVSATHSMRKQSRDTIRLLAGLGVEDDAHAGATVQHRSRVRRDPSQPNLRQVHLIHAELHDELQRAGFAVCAGDMGENITTRGLDLLALPRSTRLHLGDGAIVEVTGLRNPCEQLDALEPGLMAATIEHEADGGIVRKAGIMAIVLVGADVGVGDTVRCELPPEPHLPLEVV